MLTQTGAGLLGIGIEVAVLIPLLAVTFVVGRYLSGATMVLLFALLIALDALDIWAIVRSARSAGST
jgi:hypothetical protein